MSLDTIIKGGLVVDGSGLPMRLADVGIAGGRIVDIGHLSGAKETIDADGLVVAPGIVDAHTHYDPQLSFEPYATSSCFHGVTTVVAGNCGYSIAPTKPQDREFMTGLFAKVEGMSPEVLGAGLPWTWQTFPEFLDALDRRLGLNVACYVGHSAVRRWVMGDAASERAATDAEVGEMKRIVREAMRAGACGFSSSLAPTHVDQWEKPVPSRFSAFEEVAVLCEAAGEGGSGSISILPETAVRGLTVADREKLIDLGRRCGLPIIIQGMGCRAGKEESWEDQKRFFADARDRGAAIYSVLRTQPFMRVFDFDRGTSLLDGVFHWRDLGALLAEERLRRLADAAFRPQLRQALDEPNTDGSKGSTLPPPALDMVFVTSSAAHPEAEGKSLKQIAEERGVHAADVIADLAVADRLATGFLWSNENPRWMAASIASQSSNHMIVGTGDGGAHSDRDDGAEWSTYYLRQWILERKIQSLEEGIRRITHLPAVITGIQERGLIARGYWADVMLFDPKRIGLGKKTIVKDLPGNGERWQVYPLGVARVMVNGKTIVANGELTGAHPGRVLRVGH
jgi:N-acyl-D-amino-acid deacylase